MGQTLPTLRTRDPTSAAGDRRTTLGELPLDVLRLILRRIALRPRLFVAARVCRRWRAAVYASVASITRPFSYGGALDLYPHVSEVCIPRGTVSLPWTAEQCARITSVDLHLVAGGESLVRAFSSLTSLRVAPLSRELNSSLRCLPSAPSITHLHLVCDMSALPELPPLPSLRSLAISDDTNDYADLTPWANVISQLTHLSIAASGLAVPPPPTPSLRSLEVSVAYRCHIALTWVASLTSLTSLELRATHRALPVETLQPVASALVHLSVSPEWQEHALSTVLPGSPKLRSLALQDVSLPAAWHLIASRLHSLELSLPLSDASAITEHATALTALKLHFVQNEQLLRHWRLPLLRQLTLNETDVDFMTLALRLFPTLERLTLSVPWFEGTVNMAEAEAALREAEARGMELVEVQKGDARLVQIQRELRWLTLRKVARDTLS